ncbi:MAG: aminotransferase class V-fold PLP-dependent enzyme, partial [Candidatus Coatesbacteria bacterium]|nr:aminotransferase class V-fold PLP-dependent enzyme [Candidatus Coatesbacteria bacterium]
MEKPIESLRAAITLPNDVGYLNWASQGIIPDEALKAGDGLLRLRGRTDVDIVAHEFAATATARELAARLIDATPDDICLTTNTSIGVNLSAQAIPFEPGDELLILRSEFPANLVPWLNLQKKGVKIRYIESKSPDLMLESLEAQVGPKTRAVSLSFVQFYDGFKHDLTAIGGFCRERGLYFAVDAMQGLGACPLSVKESKIDLLSCGGAKWLAAPYGTGFCYFGERLMEIIDWMPSHGWLAYDYSKGD